MTNIVNMSPKPPQELAAKIKAEITAMRRAAQSSLEHAMRAGEYLIELKPQIGHGQWLDWLEKHCDISERMAQHCMRLANNRPELEAACADKNEMVSDLTLTGALRIISEKKAKELGRELEQRSAPIEPDPAYRPSFHSTPIEQTTPPPFKITATDRAVADRYFLSFPVDDDVSMPARRFKAEVNVKEAAIPASEDWTPRTPEQRAAWDAERGAWDVFEGIGTFLALVGVDTKDVRTFKQKPLAGMDPEKAAANLKYEYDDDEKAEGVDQHEAQKEALILTRRCIQWLAAYEKALCQCLEPEAPAALPAPAAKATKLGLAERKRAIAAVDPELAERIDKQEISLAAAERELAERSTVH